jgi:hypothetical protein
MPYLFSFLLGNHYRRCCRMGPNQTGAVKDPFAAAAAFEAEMCRRGEAKVCPRQPLRHFERAGRHPPPPTNWLPG